MFAKQLFRNIRKYQPQVMIQKQTVLESHNLFRGNACIFQRNIRFCSTLPAKTFTDTENNFVFHILNNSKAADNTPLNSDLNISDEAAFTSYLNKDWRHSNAPDIVRAFLTVKNFCITHQINFSDPRFDSLVDGLMDHCDKLTGGEILSLLNCMAEYPSCMAFTSNNYHDMWSCLDDICCWRMNTMDIEELFAIANAWYQLKLGKLCDFIFELLDKLVKKADILTKEQLLHIFFYFNVCRRRPVDFEYQYALQYKVGEMNVDELAIIALGHFKTRSGIQLVPIMEAMVKGVTSNSMGIHEITLTAIMKALRLSLPTKILSEVNQMLSSLYPELDRLSDLACLHIALLATGVQSFQPNILRKCSQKLVENLTNVRLKDIERLLNVLTMFTFDPQTRPDIFKAALQELQKESRKEEINQFPRCLASALNYLSLREIYSYEFLNKVLDYEYISESYGKHPKMLPRQLFSLDASIDIDCPDYTGKRLPPLLKYKAVKWLTEWAPSHDQWKKLNAKDKMFLDTVEALKQIVGNEEYLTIQHVLPHFPMADIIICKNIKTGCYTKPLGFERYILGDVMKPVNDGSLKWYAIVVMIWNNTVRDSTTPLGYTAMKLRQLEKIGYIPIPVVWNKFIRISPAEKQQYILEKLV